MRAGLNRVAVGLVIGVVAAAGFVIAQSSPGPARQVPYQGRLELDGTVVDGPTNLEFFLVDSEGDAYGDAFWVESHLSVPVHAGLFSVRLGSITSLPASALARPSVFVGVRVNGAELGGRQQLLPTAYAVDSVGTPPGSIVAFGGSVAPDGWLLCNGATYSATDFPRLAAVIGASFGGAGVTFQVPDLRGRMPLGLDNLGGVSANRVVAPAADVVGGVGGTALTTQVAAHTHVINAGPDHAHPVADSCNQGTSCFNGNDGLVRGPRNATIPGVPGGSHDHGGATASTGDAAVDNMPPWVGMAYIIKY